MEIKDMLATMFADRGDSEYGGENVTQIQHALQCAMLAEQEDSPPSLVVASLLHDVGHLLHDLPDDAPDQGIDDHHENSGYRFLETHFDPSVTEPVRQHVAAKRYLCTVDSEYFGMLSEPSVVSFHLQGGMMSDAELAEFQSSPHWEDSVRLRKWDDLAKVVDLKTPTIEHFLDYIDRL
jgi:phosphonate degradation associated HDIG domain protein